MPSNGILEAVVYGLIFLLIITKGEIKPKSRLTSCRAVEQTDEFDLFAVKSKKANKTNSSNHFLGEVSRL